ncbi:MAG TPA: IS3 family transposase [Chthonomonadaceae bacterium]|nr:IS3 family transposase [Chthonomonadaceae bacterium]
MLAHEYPVEMLCGLLACSRSSYYYKQASEDACVRDAIEQIAVQFSRYGYRRITAQLCRRGLQVNHKRVLRIMHEESLLVAVKRYVHPASKRHDLPRYPNLVRNVTIEYADQVWASDFTYIGLRQEWVYLAVILDLFTRAIRGWHLGRDLTEHLVTTALENALASHAAPTIHHSDQGVQYCAIGYVTRLQQAGVAVSMSAAGRPTENAFVERVIRTLKDEEVSLNEYADFADAQQRIGQFLDDVYNTKPVHSALGYRTPAEYEAHLRSRQTDGS